MSLDLKKSEMCWKKALTAIFYLTCHVKFMCLEIFKQFALKLFKKGIPKGMGVRGTESPTLNIIVM